MAMNMKESLHFQNSQSLRKNVELPTLCPGVVPHTNACKFINIYVGKDITVIELPPCARNVLMLNINHEKM